MKLLDCDNKPVLCLFSTKEIHENEEILYDYGVKNLPFEKKKVKNKSKLKKKKCEPKNNENNPKEQDELQLLPHKKKVFCTKSK